MGNCCERCFGRLDKRKYLRTRYNVERDFSIEFENLMDDEPQPEEMPKGRLQMAAGPFTVSSYMRWLVRQEEELRQEEEAYYEAKREAARAAKMQKKKEMMTKESSALVVRNGPKAWLGDDESDWDVAGGEDDFEMFLENVKARSLAARTRALPSQVPVDAASETSSKDDRSRTEASSLDLEWEHEAGMQPPPKDRSKRKMLLEERNMTELTVKPMLMLRGKPDSFDYEWDNGFEANNDSDIEENQKLLTKRKHKDLDVKR